jgi:hypothetical protein
VLVRCCIRKKRRHAPVRDITELQGRMNNDNDRIYMSDLLEAVNMSLFGSQRGNGQRQRASIIQSQPIYHFTPPKKGPFKTLNKEIINMAFPVVNFTDKESNVFGHKECMVCLIEFEHKEKIRRISLCNHIFHTECLITWLKRDESCPLCKKELSDKKCMES